MVSLKFFDKDSTNYHDICYRYSWSPENESYCFCSFLDVSFYIVSYYSLSSVVTMMVQCNILTNTQ